MNKLSDTAIRSAVTAIMIILDTFQQSSKDSPLNLIQKLCFSSLPSAGFRHHFLSYSLTISQTFKSIEKKLQKKFLRSDDSACEIFVQQYIFCVCFTLCCTGVETGRGRLRWGLSVGIQHMWKNNNGHQDYCIHILHKRKIQLVLQSCWS